MLFLTNLWTRFWLRRERRFGRLAVAMSTAVRTIMSMGMGMRMGTDTHTMAIRGTKTKFEGVRDGRTVIRAIKPIAVGEEITISYLDDDADDGEEEREDQDEEGDQEEEEELAEDEKGWRAKALREYGIA